MKCEEAANNANPSRGLFREGFWLRIAKFFCVDSALRIPNGSIGRRAQFRSKE